MFSGMSVPQSYDYCLVTRKLRVMFVIKFCTHYDTRSLFSDTFVTTFHHFLSLMWNKMVVKMSFVMNELFTQCDYFIAQCECPPSRLYRFITGVFSIF